MDWTDVRGCAPGSGKPASWNMCLLSSALPTLLMGIKLSQNKNNQIGVSCLYLYYTTHYSNLQEQQVLVLCFDLILWGDHTFVYTWITDWGLEDTHTPSENNGRHFKHHLLKFDSFSKSFNRWFCLTTDKLWSSFCTVCWVISAT